MKKSLNKGLVLAGLEELKGLKDFAIEEPMGLENQGIWFHDVLDYCINLIKLSSDLISRKRALEALGEEPLVWMDNNVELQQLNDWREVRNMLENLPSFNSDVDIIKRSETIEQFCKESCETPNCRYRDEGIKHASCDEVDILKSVPSASLEDLINYAKEKFNVILVQKDSEE